MMKIFTIFLIFCGITFAQSVKINELMTLNTNALQDEDGDYSDWLEITNSYTQPVSLLGFGLSDRLNALNKWVFPELVLQPGEFILVYASGKNKTAWVKHWETVIDQGAIWKYRPGTSEPPANWRTTGFDDTQWAAGATGIGFGDGDDATEINPVISVFLRKKFTVSDAAEVTSLALHIDYDDGFVAYLNGAEIARSNMSDNNAFPPFNESALTWREAEMYQGGSPEAHIIPELSSIVQTGENVLAIQVHNSDAGSSDMTAIPFLTLGLTTIPENPVGVSSVLGLRFPRLHTNFKLSSEGETVYLTDTDSLLIDTVATGVVPADISLGRQPDGTGKWLMFDEPTPGRTNDTYGYAGLSSPPVFSAQAGFYARPVALSLSAPAGAIIYYTIGGSEPDENATRFTQPLLISTTSVVRARTYETGKMPGKIVTASYLINESLALPVVSISSEPANFWDHDSGIYVMGPNAEIDFPYQNANFWQDWEKPVHIEFFEKDGSAGFQADAGVKITGGWSRGNDQKSLAFYLRRRYGQASIDYPMFPQLPYAEFKNFVLRNSGNDWGYTMMRDGFMSSLTDPMDIEYQAHRPVIVFINGEYWGIHNLREKMNEDYLASRFGVDPKHVDLLEYSGQVIEGTSEHYDIMMDYLTNNNIADQAVYEQVKTMMDVDNFINYQVAQIYFDNTDWPGNNIKYWRPQTPEGRWRWILFDTDFGFGLFDPNSVKHNTLEFATATDGPADWPNPPWSTYLLRRLLENDEFRIRFINSLADYLNTYFSPNVVAGVVDSMKFNIKNDISRHFQRWGGNYNDWDLRVTSLKIFAAQRPGYMRMHIMQKFGVSGNARLTLTNQNKSGGKIRINHLVLQQDKWQGIYFKGIPVTIEAIAEAGYRFAGWSQGLVSGNIIETVNLNSDMEISADFVPDTSIVINEINFNSSTMLPVDDWVELRNNGKMAIDLSGWIFRDSDETHTFQFRNNLFLKPDSFIVMARDSVMFSLSFPEVHNIAGYFDFGLSSTGEHLSIQDANGRIVDSLSYDDQPPWPMEADGSGATLALSDPLLDNSIGENWLASTPYGTPGKPNTGFLDVRQEDGNIYPHGFALGQNYPNPFNPMTTIQVTVARTGKVDLEVFDLTGRRVATIADSKMAAGSYEFKWLPASNVSSGVYFYRLQIENYFKQTKKMLYLR